MADAESIEARWVTLKELVDLGKTKPGLRGHELLEWGSYIENGGYIAPMEFFGGEGDDMPMHNPQFFSYGKESS